MRGPESDNPPTLSQTLRYVGRLLRLSKRHWPTLAQSLWLGLLASALALGIPLLTKAFVDEVYPSRNVSLLTALIIGVFSLTMATTILNQIRSYQLTALGYTLSSELGVMFFDRLQYLPISFFETHRVGELSSRFNESRTIPSLLIQSLQTLIVGGAYALLIPPVLFLLDWRLASLALISFPITSLISVTTAKYLRRYWKSAAEVAGELTAFQNEVMTQIGVVKALAAEPLTYRRSVDYASAALTLQLRARRAAGMVAILNALLKALGAVAFTWYGWTLVLRGEITLGSFVAFAAYIGLVTGPIHQVAGLLTTLQQTSVTLGRMFEYLDLTPEQTPKASAVSPAISRLIQGHIKFGAVGFSYGERQVLSDFSLSIAKGELVGIVGPNGAGKSTLVRLLLRFVSPTLGQIQVDGTDLESFDLPDLRRQIAVAWQSVSLIRGTLRENLTLGLSNVSSKSLSHAIEICGLTAFVRALPDGLNTPVAEWGANLSGGQRQRIALARMVLQDAQIILLDEATAHLDQESERQILGAILRHFQGRTIAHVTHDVSLAAQCDRVVMLDRGSVMAQGKHRDLLQTSETYRRLHEDPRRLLESPRQIWSSPLAS